jgi:decaprenylphospho-beta-D-erythro-pentofuranosid-2-ulose 2-reductase
LGKRVLILGALSAVAEAVARIYAKDGAELVLVGRRDEALRELAQDLAVRGAKRVETRALDLAGPEAGRSFDALVSPLGGIDVVLLAYGQLTDEARAAEDATYAASQFQTNFVSAALWSLAAADLLKRQGSGALVVIGSVAGDRGRGSNAVYGSAKAGLGALVQGLAHRLAGTGARAVLVKPGFIDTPMTAHLKKGGPLWASPEAIAQVIVKAADRSGPVVYAPWFWRFILLIIRLVPAPVFHKTKL